MIHKSLTRSNFVKQGTRAAEIIFKEAQRSTFSGKISELPSLYVHASLGIICHWIKMKYHVQFQNLKENCPSLQLR